MSPNVLYTLFSICANGFCAAPLILLPVLLYSTFSNISPVAFILVLIIVSPVCGIYVFSSVISAFPDTVCIAFTVPCGVPSFINTVFCPIISVFVFIFVTSLFTLVLPYFDTKYPVVTIFPVSYISFITWKFVYFPTSFSVSFFSPINEFSSKYPTFFPLIFSNSCLSSSVHVLGNWPFFAASLLITVITSANIFSLYSTFTWLSNPFSFISLTNLL